MRAHVDRDLYDGNAVCTLEAPEGFRMGDDDHLQILREEPADDQRPAEAGAAEATS